MLTFIKNLFSKPQLDYPTLIKEGAVIIDVRSPKEFSGGHTKNAINIPLGEIQNHLLKLKRQEKPIVTCCRSGARSGRATAILKKAGIEVYNGGSWGKVQEALDNL